MIVSHVIVIGLMCADAGTSVSASTTPQAASIIPTTIAVANNGPIARPSLLRPVCVDRMPRPTIVVSYFTRQITARSGDPPR